jgi:hypothetical protein
MGLKCENCKKLAEMSVKIEEMTVLLTKIRKEREQFYVDFYKESEIKKDKLILEINEVLK